ncbi:hypothetical protein ACFX19_031578 [Malus domestica]
MSSEQHRIFQEWAKKEFTASFSLKALCDLEKLMEESMQTKERVKVVSSEIQKLEEQLIALKAEQATLLDTLEHQIEGVEKATSELEQAKSQLVNNHTVLAEPSRIFTIMRTYHSRIITLCEDVKFLE